MEMTSRSWLDVCAHIPFSLTPGDNSHYVEGESRYIWMPDGMGVPHLVDLQGTADPLVLMGRNGENNRYLLYTRQNPTTPQLLFNGDYKTLSSSNFLAKRPINVIVHGWLEDESSSINTILTAAFLHKSDCNVIFVDWSHLAQNNYFTVVFGVHDIGRHIGYFLKWLVKTGRVRWDQIHLVGHSLGAHIVGNAGRITGGLPARVTGLDPAGPLWYDNLNALQASDAKYVEAIYTDAGILGIDVPLGKTNFYPNGGRNPQPNCWFSICSHSRSYLLFASTIYNNKLVGKKCKDRAQADSNKCTGTTLHMGNDILLKSG